MQRKDRTKNWNTVRFAARYRRFNVIININNINNSSNSSNNNKNTTCARKLKVNDKPSGLAVGLTDSFRSWAAFLFFLVPLFHLLFLFFYFVYDDAITFPSSALLGATLISIPLSLSLSLICRPLSISLALLISSSIVSFFSSLLRLLQSLICHRDVGTRGWT